VGNNKLFGGNGRGKHIIHSLIYVFNYWTIKTKRSLKQTIANKEGKQQSTMI
jgi:hypothetical protein